MATSSNTTSTGTAKPKKGDKQKSTPKQKGPTKMESFYKEQEPSFYYTPRWYRGTGKGSKQHVAVLRELADSDEWLAVLKFLLARGVVPNPRALRLALRTVEQAEWKGKTVREELLESGEGVDGANTPQSTPVPSRSQSPVMGVGKESGKKSGFTPASPSD
jgi:hypothetical protein